MPDRASDHAVVVRKDWISRSYGGVEQDLTRRVNGFHNLPVSEAAG